MRNQVSYVIEIPKIRKCKSQQPREIASLHFDEYHYLVHALPQLSHVNGALIHSRGGFHQSQTRKYVPNTSVEHVLKDVVF